MRLRTRIAAWGLPACQLIAGAIPHKFAAARSHELFQEAHLLRSGRSGLRAVAHGGAWTIYALPQPTPIVTPTRNAKVVALSGTQLHIAVLHPGWIDIRLHDTPYWSAVSSTAQSCIRPAANGMIALHIDRPGMVTLSFKVTPQHMMDALLGRSSPCVLSSTAERVTPATHHLG